jgi:antitoxin MazE
MGTVIKTRIVRVGNSQGIRIPKPVLEQVGLDRELELDVEPGRLVIRPVRRPREGWDDRFREMAARKDDRLLDDHVPTSWDRREWRWR